VEWERDDSIGYLLGDGKRPTFAAEPAEKMDGRVVNARLDPLFPEPLASPLALFE
jgi:hypothetical protein